MSYIKYMEITYLEMKCVLISCLMFSLGEKSDNQCFADLGVKDIAMESKVTNSVDNNETKYSGFSYNGF